MNDDHNAVPGLLLAVDVGNTNVVLGLFENDLLVHNWRLATSVSRTPDEAWIMLDSLCKAEGVESNRITGLAISSVVPDLTSIFAEMAVHKVIQSPKILCDWTALFHIQDRIQLKDDIHCLDDVFTLGGVIPILQVDDGLFQKTNCTIIEHDNQAAVILGRNGSLLIDFESVHVCTPGNNKTVDRSVCSDCYFTLSRRILSEGGHML